VGKNEGLIDGKSGEMIQGILELSETIAREVMVPRTEIVALSSDSTIKDILDFVSKHGHTRMPVYSENIDNIVGILNVKDLLRFWSEPVTEGNIDSILRKAYYIPETKNIHLLLHELKEKKSHMAIVIDEYGGTSGLVTLEDLIEEIVGEIHDEHDIDENAFMKLENGDVVVDGRVEIEEFEEYFGIKVPEGQFETLGGFIFFIIKKIPITGESLRYQDLEMIIEGADERSIKRVRIKREGESVPGSNKEKRA
jgi:CBS domain containing-hemolysin-like protein